MTPTSARIAEDFTARFYRGEPIVLELQLEDADGAPEDLASRKFFAALYRSSGEVFDRAVGVVAIDTNARPYLTCAFNGDISDALYGEQLLRYAIGEMHDSGNDIIVDGALIILPAPTGLVAGSGTIVDGIATRFVRRLAIGGRSRIVVSERGPAGLSAAQIAVAANDIEEPTPEAFMAHLRSTASDAAREVAFDQVGNAITELGEFTSERSAEIDVKLIEAGTTIGQANAARDGALSATVAARSVVDAGATILAAAPVAQAAQAKAETARVRAEAAVLSLSDISTQIVGRSVDPVTGNAGSAAGLLLGDPIAKTGVLASIKVFVLATGPLTIYRYTRNGTTYTRGASYTATLSTLGLCTLTAADFGIGSIPVSAGEYLGVSINNRWAVTGSTAADGAGWQSIDPAATSATINGFNFTSRLEIQFSVTAQVQVVTKEAFAGVKGQAETAQAGAAAAKTVTDQLVTAASQQIGRAATPVDGSLTTVPTVIMATPVAAASRVLSVKLYAKSAGLVRIARATKSGTTYTVQAVSNAVSVTVGAKTLTATGANDLGSFQVQAGDYLLLLGQNVITNTGNVADDSGGWTYSTTDGSTVGATIANPSALAGRIEAQFNLDASVQVVTAAAFKALKEQADAALAGGAGAASAVANLIVTSAQQIGRSAALVDGSAATVSTLILSTPVVNTGNVTSVSIYAKAALPFRLARATKSGTTYTVQAVSKAVTVAVGAQTLTCTGPNDLGVFPVQAGDYLLILAPGVLGYNNGPDDSGGWTYSSTDASTVGAVINNPSTLGTNRLETRISLTSTIQVVTAATFNALKAELAASKVALEAVVAGTAKPRSLRALAEMEHHIIHGQSLSLGWNGTPVLSAVPLSFAKRSQAGVRPQDSGSSSADNWSSIVDLIETVNGPRGETPASGHALMVRQLMLAEFGIDIATTGKKLLYSAPGVGGTAIANLDTGSGSFAQLLADMTNAKAAAGVSYAPQALYWIQGETDYEGNTAADVYKTLFRAMRVDTQNQARLVVGRDDLIVPAITYQTSTHLGYGRAYPNIALAQLEMAADDYIALACPCYFFPFSDGVHLTATGYKWLGAYLALIYWRWIVRGVKPMPLAPTSAARSNNTLLLKYPVRDGLSLRWDTAAVAAQAAYGFTVVDAADVAQTISNVRIVDPVSGLIAMDCAVVPAAGWKVRYAHQGAGGRGLGNLRDNQGDALVFDPAGINKPMHNWALISETTVA
jgi:hypothetical protein